MINDILLSISIWKSVLLNNHPTDLSVLFFVFFLIPLSPVRFILYSTWHFLKEWNFIARPPTLISLLSCALCSPLSIENESWIVDWLTGRWIEILSEWWHSLMFFSSAHDSDFFPLFLKVKTYCVFFLSLHLCTWTIGWNKSVWVHWVH